MATTIGPGVFAALGKQQSRFLFVVVFGFVRDPPAFEGRDIDRRSISWGLETRAAKGHTIDEALAVGRNLVPAAQAALPSVSGIQGPNAVMENTLEQLHQVEYGGMGRAGPTVLPRQP